MIEIKRDTSSVRDGRLYIAEEIWRDAVLSAQPDPVVGIRHAALGGDETYRRHVALIPDRVGCHFHASGNEDYAVVQGKGTLYWGKVEREGHEYAVRWGKPLSVQEGDRFVIPEGYAHQLAREGGGDLIILFGCPDSHLNDDDDRTILPDAPEIKRR